jgi:N-acetylneuraminic acid mutarotase
MVGVVVTAVSGFGVPAMAVGPAGGSGAPNTWVPTGAMSVARSGQVAVRLLDGRVLVAGGSTASAQLYDAASGTFSVTGSLSVVRRDATATLLVDGDVLVAGGCCRGGGGQLSSAELYDPSTGHWALTGSMSVARSGQTATLLPDGEVLVAGGGCNGHAYGCDAGSFEGALSSAELYDPTTGTWSVTASMHDGRQFHTATLLATGKVLVAGGFNNCDDDFCSDVRSAELYDPTTRTWTVTGSMHLPREQHSATLLPDGAVLVAGGLNEGGFGSSRDYAQAELYNATTGTWTETASMTQPRFGHTATLLANGWVLVAGGATTATELYEPNPGIWVSSGAMSTPRTDPTATLLGDGQVLVAGGTGTDGQAQATAERYLAGKGPLVSVAPSTVGFGAQQVGTTGPSRTFTVTNDGSANLTVSGVTVSGEHPGDFFATTNCNAAPLPPGGSCTVSARFAPSNSGLRTAVVGVADNAPLSPQTVVVSGYGAGPNSWTPTGSLSTGRDGATATLLPNGTVLVAGGESGPDTALGSAELYDPATHTFAATGSLLQARVHATATLLRDGEVLVAGGLGPGPSVLSSAELYDPATRVWSLTSAMKSGGYFLSSVLLRDGKVLVSGFVSGNGAEVYDPAARTWTDTGPVVAPGFFSTATLLADGDVLGAGGNTTAAALYDPTTNSWAATGSMRVAQERPTATALPDGHVLLAGGDAPSGGPLSTSELFDPATQTWSLTSGAMNMARDGHTATLLSNGVVLVAGGCTSVCDNRQITASSEIYNPADGYWFAAAPMTQARFAATATLLADGQVLVAGGNDYCCEPSFNNAELYTTTLLSANPNNGPVGQPVTLTGTGYFANEKVAVTWDGAKLASTRTTGHGDFTVAVTVPSTSVGIHTVTAIGQTSFAGAQDTFTVTATP